MKRIRTLYVARWLDSSSGGQIGNVSFFARSTAEAIRKADRIGREIGLPHSARTIHRDSGDDFAQVHSRPYQH